jgi:recombination protein RecR
MNEIDKLTEYFTKFPGVGIRQARRFVYYLLSRDSGARKTIARLIEEIGKNVHQCSLCGRFSSEQKSEDSLCDICLRSDRRSTLLIIEKDADLERIEKSGAYRGRYFVLGGIIPLASEEPGKHVRLSPLEKHLKEGPEGLEEVILGLSVTPDGEHTTEVLTETLRPILEKSKIRLTHLGRGLSTGSELEYADRATIESALQGRK